MNEGDIFICKKYISPAWSNVEFNIGDRGEVGVLQGKFYISLRKKDVGVVVGIRVDIFSEHFETIGEHRNRIIDLIV